VFDAVSIYIGGRVALSVRCEGCIETTVLYAILVKSDRFLTFGLDTVSAIASTYSTNEHS